MEYITNYLFSGDNDMTVERYIYETYDRESINIYRSMCAYSSYFYKYITPDTLMTDEINGDYIDRMFHETKLSMYHVDDVIRSICSRFPYTNPHELRSYIDTIHTTPVFDHYGEQYQFCDIFIYYNAMKHSDVSMCVDECAKLLAEDRFYV